MVIPQNISHIVIYLSVPYYIVDIHSIPIAATIQTSQSS